MSEDTQRSRILAEKALDAFMKAPELDQSGTSRAEAALRAHTVEADLEGGLEGDMETQIWHLLLSLANYCDEKGFFRDHVFGPRQAGGPQAHLLVSGVRELCTARGYLFDDIYQEVNEHIAIDGPVAPRI